MPLNKSQLLALNQTNFPDNTQQLITPELLRDFNDDMIASMQLTQSMDNYANLSTANIFYGGNQSIEKEYKLFTNGVYWNNNTAGYNNLEIINSITGNIDIAALGGGVRIVSSSLNITNGTFTASLAEGFTYVGNGSGRTSLVSTSSFGSSINTGSFITTSSFNAYTQSINSATASLFTSTSLSLTTASFSGNTLTFTKGNGSTFGVVIPDISGSNIPAGTVSSSAQIVNYNIFATTGSNNFKGSQNISSSANIGDYLGTDRVFISQNGIQLFNATQTNISFEAANNFFSAGGNFFLGNTLGGIGSGSITMTADNGGNISVSGSQTNIAGVNFIPFSASVNSRISGFATTGSNTFSGSQFITGGVQIKEYIQTGAQQLSLEAEYAIKTNRKLLGNGFELSGSAETEALNIYYPGTRWQHAGSVVFTNQVNYPVSGAAYEGSGSIDIIAYGGGPLRLSGSNLTLSDVPFIPFSASLNTRIQQLMTTGSASGNVLTFSKGDGSTFNLTVATGSGGGGSTFTNPSVESISGSLLLTANTFTSGAANVTNLSASAQNQVNLVFKNNNNTATTIISGSNNIFTNPAAVTVGYARYIGGSNNLYLNSTNGINSQITASAASVSGNRPSMTNNIFNGTVGFTINQAVNTGDHDYSNNIFNGNGSVTINALAHTGSLSVTANITPNGNITINASSASIAEIATGISGSGAVNVRGNIVQGNGSITITSPRRFLPTNTQSTLGNFVAGGSLTVTNISSSAAVSSNNNVLNAGISYTNAGAAGLGLHTTAGAISNNYGGATIIASGSAVKFNFNTTSGNNLTVTNQAFSGSYGVGVFNILRNIFFGQSGTLLITGSVDGTGNTTGAFTDNAVIGKSNTIFSNQSGAGLHNSFISNVVGGEQLIISASNSFNSTIGGGAYFGRYNANDGVRNKTGQTVFSVGTGTSTARKTGLLIDSGSNMFVEGTLNVSGSTTMTGSLILSSSNATELFVIGNSEFTGSVKVASTFQLQLPTGSNQQAGTAVLDGANPSTVVVSNSLVTANSIIMVSKQTLTNAHSVAVSSKGAGTFTIQSSSNGDTDTVGWFIINNS